jgi:hypothetical protein
MATHRGSDFGLDSYHDQEISNFEITLARIRHEA